MRRYRWMLFALTVGAGCASQPLPAPVTTPPSPPVVISLDRRVGMILRLEDQRWLDDGAGANLLTLISDTDARVRRRAALAIGRIGMSAGVPALVGALGDTDKDVRAMAAFGLGLIGAASATDPLITALGDADSLVRARAAEALALIGEPKPGTPPAAPASPRDTPAGTAIAAMAVGCRGQIASLAPDDERWPMAEDVEMCRSAILALARLKQYDALAKVVLDEKGQPVSSWWPVAFALQRVGDKRAAAALAALINVDGVNTASFAFRGLGAYGDRRGLAAARAVAERRGADVRLRVSAVRMLAQLKDVESLALLGRLLDEPAIQGNLLLESVVALGAIGDPKAFDMLADLFSHKWSPIRAAALDGAAKVDPDAFLILVSGLGVDKEWSVRAKLAEVLSTLEPDRVRAALVDLAAESDPRVQAPALEGLAKVGAPDLDARLIAALDAPDFVVRATAARLVGQRKGAGAAERLAAAYTRGASDVNPSARAAVIDALAAMGKDAGGETLHAALADADWSVRMRAASLLRARGETTAEPKRPAPLRYPLDYYESPALLRPPYSPHAFIETKFGTIEIELNVVDAPMATQSFVTLARKGFFNGMRIHPVVPNFVVQSGDDRGDGEGGPGYTFRDELSAIPYRRGTVGMALDGADSGGSQFFIALAPQPHLDAKYAVFGEVVRGMEILDLLTQWDVIDRIRVWDGVSF